MVFSYVLNSTGVIPRFNQSSLLQSVSGTLIHVIYRYPAIQIRPVSAAFTAGSDVDPSAFGLSRTFEAVPTASTAIDRHQCVWHPATSLPQHDQARNSQQASRKHRDHDHPHFGARSEVQAQGECCRDTHRQQANREDSPSIGAFPECRLYEAALASSEFYSLIPGHAPFIGHRQPGYESNSPNTQPNRLSCSLFGVRVGYHPRFLHRC